MQTSTFSCSLERKQSFNSFGALMEEYSITIHQSRIAAWRLTKPLFGQIHGLPHLGSCKILATDGVHAFVASPIRYSLIEVHVRNFEGKILPLNSKEKQYFPKIKHDTKKRTPDGNHSNRKARVPSPDRKTSRKLDLTDLLSDLGL